MPIIIARYYISLNTIKTMRINQYKFNMDIEKICVVGKTKMVSPLRSPYFLYLENTMKILNNC